ncbi:unnamed protein product [Polarella glacialis]|uniref:Uncharacterized protein n=1 Tax=Polarella glacialis TaxID=89957 RepID=A0A813EER3_POLGL|nr:unnamed protein product [Polarella glacialis]
MPLSTAISSDPSCRDYGVQQRLAAACGSEVTNLMRCCASEGLNFCEILPPLARNSPTDRGVCSQMHFAVVRCVAQTLQAGRGGAYDMCARDFAAVCAETGSEGAVSKRSWSCAWKYFGSPLQLMMVTATALGECRPSGMTFNDNETANEAKFRSMWAGTAL